MSEPCVVVGKRYRLDRDKPIVVRVFALMGRGRNRQVLYAEDGKRPQWGRLKWFRPRIIEEVSDGAGEGSGR